MNLPHHPQLIKSLILTYVLFLFWRSNPEVLLCITEYIFLMFGLCHTIAASVLFGSHRLAFSVQKSAPAHFNLAKTVQAKCSIKQDKVNSADSAFILLII